MKTQIGITEEHLGQSVMVLEQILSDEMTLYIKTRKFHWNVTGDSFMELHKLFQTQYMETEEVIDEVAERIGKLGGKSIGTMKEFTQHTRLKEFPGKYPTQQEMIKELLGDHETVVKQLRKDVAECGDVLNDAGTADFLTGMMEQHETTAWILRRYLS